MCVLTYVPGNYPAKVLLKDVKIWKQSHGCRVKKNCVFVLQNFRSKLYFFVCSFRLYFIILIKIISTKENFLHQAKNLSMKFCYSPNFFIECLTQKVKQGILAFHDFTFCDPPYSVILFQASISFLKTKQFFIFFSETIFYFFSYSFYNLLFLHRYCHPMNFQVFRHNNYKKRKKYVTVDLKMLFP